MLIMSTKYLAEKLTRKVLIDIFGLIKGTQRYTSKEIVAILGSEYTPGLIRDTLYRLRRQQYISGGAYKGYELTNKGKSRLNMLEFEMLQQTAIWDKTWRLVIYDIPEENRKARDTVRRLIKRLGFAQLQQSVWAHPLPCLDEFQQIRDSYGVQNHILLIETPHTIDHDSLLEKFQKSYPDLQC